jgi:hypothetical protein
MSRLRDDQWRSPVLLKAALSVKADHGVEFEMAADKVGREAFGRVDFVMEADVVSREENESAYRQEAFGMEDFRQGS